MYFLSCVLFCESLQFVLISGLINVFAKSLSCVCSHQLFYYFCFRARTDDKLAAFQTLGEQMGIACYLDGAFANALFICRHFHDDFEGGVLTNVNVGGDRSPMFYLLVFVDKPVPCHGY